MKGSSKPRRRKKNGRPDPKVLDDIVRRVVEAAQPERIILFGSAARGEMGPDSDIDLLVIKSGRFNHGRLLTTIYRRLPGLAAVDVVLARAEDIERYGDSPYLVYYPALREGKVVYGPDRNREPQAEHRTSEGSGTFPALRRRANMRNHAGLPCEDDMGRKRYPPTDPREWLNRARSNLAMAQADSTGAVPEDLCYEAQQAAEKAVKAVFIRRGVRFPYIHDLEELLLLLERDGLKVPKYVKSAKDLTRFALETRYPGASGPVNRRQHRRAVRIAESVVRWAERQIGKP
jgi:HEPN domain-containing protein/predicted nucleotidyltransferase